MKIEQLRWKRGGTWNVEKSDMENRNSAQLVLVFSDPDCLGNQTPLAQLQERFPNARIVGGSTSGNILGTEVSDDDMVATAIYLEKARLAVKIADIDDPADVTATVTRHMQELAAEDLRHVFVLSDGLNFNGSDVAKGVNSQGVSVTGGLMGDKARFEKTQVIADQDASEKRIALIAFYGDDLTITHGCNAGWGEFGVDRIITRSEGNVVFEIDGQPALALYKKYLGDLASELPASGLRFPMSIRMSPESNPLIRTLLAVDEEAQSLIFAGDMPEGAISLLMRGNIDDLVEGAKNAGAEASTSTSTPGLGILVSCVGRRLVMDQLTEEELEAVEESLGENFWLTGFYSYGELAPHSDQILKCELHNQTMTLTVLGER